MSLVIRKEEASGVTSLTLNRPDKRNALSIALMEALLAAVADIHDDPNERVVIFQGAGPLFCAGLDLKETVEPHEGEHPSAGLIRKLLQAVYKLPQVTIAAVHGGAIAGGAGLMSACDLVIAAEGTKIGYPETKRGLVAGLVMTFLRRQLRERDARELLLVPELIDATQAQTMGLVSRVVGEGELHFTAMQLAYSICQGAPNATANTKTLLDALWHSSVEQDLESAMNFHQSARGSKEAEEGINAFLEKRPASWQTN